MNDDTTMDIDKFATDEHDSCSTVYLSLYSPVHNSRYRMPAHMHEGLRCVSLTEFIITAKATLCPRFACELHTKLSHDYKCPDCHEQIFATLQDGSGRTIAHVIGFGPIRQNHLVVRVDG